MSVVAFILTSTPHAYEQWLYLLNNGGKVPLKDRTEFPRAESVEQVTALDPVPMVYTWGNYFASEKGVVLHRKLTEVGVIIKPYPIVERNTQNGIHRKTSLNI